jgi:hypothetical protein
MASRAHSDHGGEIPPPDSKRHRQPGPQRGDRSGSRRFSACGFGCDEWPQQTWKKNGHLPGGMALAVRCPSLFELGARDGPPGPRQCHG